MEQNVIEKRGRPRKGSITTLSEVGRGAAYRVGCLKRDYPVIADRLAAGEFPSVSAAERAAGIKTKLTALEAVQRI